jgi:hypothetical protein
MKKRSSSRDAFFYLRVVSGIVLGGIGVALALLSFAEFSKTSAQAGGQTQPTAPASPEIVRMIGPVSVDQDLRNLPYIAPKVEFEERVLTRHPHPAPGQPAEPSVKSPNLAATLLKDVLQPASPATIPPPLLSFDGVAETQSGCGCEPPDTNGDVGPNHYIQAVNSSFKIFDKSGNTLSGPTTYNSLFAPLTGTPCSGANDGDPFTFYDHVADRWVVSDFAFASLNGPFYQCIAVSKTSDPVSGGWFLYAVQHDSANVQWLGDYPKLALWNNPQPGGAYLLTVNLFFGPTLGPFEGVGVFALDRGSMLSGGPANAVHFDIPIAGLGDSYSLVPATFRTGDPPPAGRDEFLLAIDSPATGGVTLTQVKGWLFHIDFTGGGSTLGIGTNHSPNSLITVNGFIDGFTSTAGFSIVPQQGTTSKLDTLGDKIMTPLVYQSRSGTESLWSSNTVCTDASCANQTGIRWYQFDVTGGAFPATPTQQQTWTNGNDGVWRFMSSIAVDSCGDTALNYATSSTSLFPGIRYAGRLVTDPLNNLSQGEATLFTGTGSQTSNRWGDYSMIAIDPADDATFWMTNEYYATTSSFNWKTRIGNFKFDSCGGGGDIVLQAQVRRQNGKRIVALSWSPADGGTINVLRNGAVIGTTNDDGSAQDKLGSQTGIFTYQVCETDSGDCSNEVRVKAGGADD